MWIFQYMFTYFISDAAAIGLGYIPYIMSYSPLDQSFVYRSLEIFNSYKNSTKKQIGIATKA